MKFKVLLATRELGGVLGGLERQISEIAAALSDKGFEVHLLFLSNDKRESFFEIDKRVFQHRLDGLDPRNKASYTRRLQRQVRVFQLFREIKPSIVISFMTGSFFFTALPALLLRIPRILAERNSPQIYRVTAASSYRFLIFISMVLATRITTQFEKYKEGYPLFLRKRMVVIPNSIPRAIYGRDLADKKEHTMLNYVFAGRFSFQKRVDFLIRVFAEFAKLKSDVNLKIFGSGTEEVALKESIKSLGQFNQIEILPPSKDLPSEILEADALCIPSLWEGFPNVLLESLYLGVPGIGFSDCDGVDDLIEHGINGWKAPFDYKGESYLRLLISSYDALKEKRISPISCRESVSEYVPEKVYDLWVRLIESLISRK